MFTYTYIHTYVHIEAVIRQAMHCSKVCIYKAYTYNAHRLSNTYTICTDIDAYKHIKVVLETGDTPPTYALSKHTNLLKDAHKYKVDARSFLDAGLLP